MKETDTKEKALKENTKIVIVMELIGVICLAIGIIFEDLVFIGVIGLILIPAGFFVLSDGKKRINRSFCPYCGEKYDYENDVSWEETERFDEENKVVANVEFECCCSNCGETQEFSQKFTILSYDKNKNTWKQNNLKTMARKYFWK